MDEWTPRDPKHFGIRLMAYISDRESNPGADLFDAVVCSPTWFAEAMETHRLNHFGGVGEAIVFGHAFIFMRTWDYPLLHKSIEDIVTGAAAPDWETAASRIHRTLEWEFCYRYDDEVNEGRR